MARLNLLEETRFEKLQVSVFETEKEACKKIAKKIASIIISNNNKQEKTILGLATGASPIGVYTELIRLHKEEGLSFKNVVTFNLDEYYPMQPSAEQSYVKFMKDHLFDHIDINFEHVHIPDGTLSVNAVQQFCLEYEKKISEYGGLDLQILGIGRTGHIGFNEPGSAPNSGSRLVTLDELTKKDAAKDFGGKANVPLKAITMGVGTIFKAKEIILMAWGSKKAAIIKKAVEGEISSQVPATYLQLSENVTFFIDEDAASSLTRFDTPWLVKDCVWNEKLIKKAVIWLAKTLNKPILKLTEEDYNTHGMAQLALEKGPVYNINIHIFNLIQHTITGWPGGKPNADDTQRPERASPPIKRSLIFSPHPDDDVISMGGTFIRLVEQGHQVNVAYQTSGNNAVWDDDVIRYLEFALELSDSLSDSDKKLKVIYEQIIAFLATKKPNQNDPEALKLIKGLIRKGEAAAGARYCGLNDAHIHFMNLPFYEQRKTTKDNLGLVDDINQTISLLQKIKPHQIFAAGDFADPHNTHKICFDVIKQALEILRKTEDWAKECWLWLYRGAWHEWEIHEIEMAVPLSPQELEKKRNAIFKHQSQKDKPVFPGDDAREFWVRVEERNRDTANQYDNLGLANYEAMEAFVKWKFD
jgi:glucosamine-6-phosphate deaminase